MSFEKGPRFSFPAEEPNRAAWITEANRITEDENWEDDPDVMNMHSNIRGRIEALGKGGITDVNSERLEAIEVEELVRFADDFPEKAEHYADIWAGWTKMAGIDTDIDDDDWDRWRREHPEAKNLGQYRSIARIFNSSGK